MSTERLYYRDSHLTEFDARVIEHAADARGRAGVRLDRTAFYPEGGGQPSDTGVIEDARVVECIDEEEAGVLHVLEGTAPAGGARVRPLRDGEVVEAGGARLRAHHAPGHASDHVVLTLEGERCLFSGDNVLGEGTAVIDPPDGDMAAYMRTLELLRSLAPRRIFPGHFRALDDGERVIEGYLEHRRRRAAAIEAALGDAPVGLDAIVERAYADTPQHLHAYARRSALAQLELLADEGRVERVADERWRRRRT